MYKTRDVVLTGFALFAMLFGAGNLIFPPMLGRGLASAWLIGTLAFILTGVGFPLLGILAAAFSEKKDINDFANKVSPLFARFFFISLILAIGPLLAIPRTGAVAYEVTFLHGGLDSPMLKYVYLAVYFTITLLFSLRPNKVVSRIGTYLTPLLLVMLTTIILRGIFDPLGVATISDIQNSFKIGFVEGYQTMDTLASVVFAIVILKSIRGERSLTKKTEFRFLVKASILAATGLALVYGGLAYIGSTLSGMAGTMTKTELLVYLTIALLGKAGYYILGLCVAGACLSTSIGLVATVADYFEELLGWTYQSLAIGTTVLSFIFACFGVDWIVKISVPVLVFLYPLAMVLILLNLFKVESKAVFRGAVLGAGLVSFYEMLGVFSWQPESLQKIYTQVPLSAFGLAWLLPSFVVALLFLSLAKVRKGIDKN